MQTNISEIHDDLGFDVVEWIDGERVPLDEYECRLQNQTQYNAGLFLLSNDSDLNWIFGIDAP